MAYLGWRLPGTTAREQAKCAHGYAFTGQLEGASGFVRSEALPGSTRGPRIASASAALRAPGTAIRLFQPTRRQPGKIRPAFSKRASVPNALACSSPGNGGSRRSQPFCSQLAGFDIETHARHVAPGNGFGDVQPLLCPSCGSLYDHWMAERRLSSSSVRRCTHSRRSPVHMPLRLRSAISRNNPGGACG